MIKQSPMNLKPWEIYNEPKSWPSSASGVFLGEAVQIIGRAAIIDWDDAAPSWITLSRLPDIPPVYESFANGEPIGSVHDAYSDAVRTIISSGEFAATELTEREWIRSAVKVPGLDTPMPACLVRARRGDDANDPITYGHWEYASFESTDHNECIKGGNEKVQLIASILLPPILRGELDCFVRPCGSAAQAPKPLCTATWEIDDIRPRLAWCGLDLDAPHDMTLPPTHWIFVAQDQLTGIAAAIEPRLLMELPPCSPPAAQGYSEKVVEDVSKILLKLFEAYPDLKQREYQDFCEERRGCAASRTNWKFAWAQATSTFPSKRRPGRPRTRPRT